MRLRSVLLLAALAAAAPLSAQQKAQGKAQVAPDSTDRNLRAYAELLRSDIKTQKVAIYTQLMDLDEKESAAFWPIQREYEVELAGIGDQKLALIQEYGRHYADMTDEKADELAKKALDLDQKRLDLRKKYYERFKKALSPITAARFLQIENQILLLIDLQIASSLPIIEEGPTQ